MTALGSPPRIAAKQRPGDRIFAGSALIAGSLILATLALVAAFLVIQSVPAVTVPADQLSILGGATFVEYVVPLVFGTIWAAVIALVLAVPVDSFSGNAWP